MRALALPLGIYLATRLVSAVIILASEPPTSSYWEVVDGWDGPWYRRIAEHGYDLDPAIFVPPVPQNSIAYFPLYPMLCRVLMQLTGLDFAVVASTLSLVLGAIGVVLLYRWLNTTRGRAAALTVTITLCAFPTAPILQAAYTESLGLLLIVVALRAADESRFVTLGTAFVLIGLTRAASVPILLVAAWILWRAWRRGELSRGELSRGELSRGDRVRAVWTLGVGVLSVVLWPALAAIMTGSPTAFFDTQAAWASAGGLRGGWFSGLWIMAGPMAAIGLALIIAVPLMRALTRPHRPAPDPVPLWAGVYACWILSVTTPSTSIFRYVLLCLIPFGPIAFDLGRLMLRRPTLTWVLLAAVIAAEVALQAVWIQRFLIFGSDRWGFP